MKNKIYCIEGLSTSGKTSLCNYFKKKGIIIIKENSEKNRKGSTFLEKQSSFLDKNLQDLFSARKLNKIVFLDRFVPSTLAFTYSYDKENNTKILNLLMKKYKSKLKDDSDICYIYLRLSPEDCLKRRKFLNKYDKFIWSDKEIISNIFDFYEGYFKNKHVHVIDARLPLKEIYKIMEGILRNDAS